MSLIRRTLPALVALSAALAPAIASAQVADPGFEQQPTPNASYLIYGGGSSFGGWNVVGTQVLLLNTNYSENNGVGNATLTFNAHSGLNSLDLTGAGNNGLTAGVQQSIMTTAGQNYLLNFYVGRATGNFYYATPSTVDLSIDGGARVSFTNANLNPNVIDWQQFMYAFTATGASTSVTFFNGTPDNNFAGLDDVSVSAAATATPEPATVGLLLSALPLLGLGAWRRRKALTA